MFLFYFSVIIMYILFNQLVLFLYVLTSLHPFLEDLTKISSTLIVQHISYPLFVFHFMCHSKKEHGNSLAIGVPVSTDRSDGWLNGSRKTLQGGSLGV